MESKLINYSIFIEKRPDMEVHTEVAITSCINSAYVLLDGECASLISQVDKFNMVEDRTQLDTNNVLYRTDFELGQLQEALVFQVQYVLNMGNDFTVGGGSYSIGNINSSYNRPEGRELVAPGVYKLLSNARVYHLNAFGSFSNQNTNEIPLSTSKEIMERVKNEYVAQNQPNAQVGQVAYINQSKQVDFGNPQDLNITTYNTNRVAGGEGYRTNYYEIDNVPNIAFFGPDLNGTYSAVHRQEMVDYVNTNAGADLAQKITQIQEEQIIQNQNIQANRTAITTKEKVDEQQNTAIETNFNNINTIKADLGDLGNQVVDVQNKTNANTTNIQNNTNNIQTNTTNITSLDSRLVSVSALLNDTINGLKTLKPFEYVGEYQAGTTYRINQAVSLNNNLYLSKEDNNTTTPPGAKWLLLNEDFATIDLTQYYTKLEIDTFRTNLQNNINTNATNITTIRNNYLDKTSTGNNIIAGNSTYFTHSVYVNQPYNANLTPNYDFLVNGNSSLDNAIFNGNVEFTNSPTVPNPTLDNHATNKGYVDNQLTNLSGVVKTTGDQTISGTKTFNAPLVFPNRQAINSTSNNMTVAHINAQEQKFLKFDFEQTSGGFQNYGWLQMNAKHLTNPWTEIFSIGFKNQDNAANQGVWMNCSNNKFIFGNPTKVSNVATPTNDNDAVNKRYVDSIAGATLSNWERVYSVSNFNPIDGASINYLFMNDYEYFIYIDTFNTVLKGQTQIHFFPNLKGTNDETGDDDYITRMFLAHTGQNGKSWNTDFFTIGIFRRSQIRFLPNERNYNALNSVKINVRIYRRRQ